MEQVLQFFNFGDNIIRWIKVLCTNREACIIPPKNLFFALADAKFRLPLVSPHSYIIKSLPIAYTVGEDDFQFFLDFQFSTIGD
jgi:hypothetical protein